MRNPTAILSLLHEPIGRGSAHRRFRGEPVVAWTLDRLSRCALLQRRAIVCWEDQLPSLQALIDEYECHALVKGPRVTLPAIEAIDAAQRWADGWRGGLLGTCGFDRGFHGPFFMEVIDRLDADIAVLVDPSSALVDPVLIDAMIRLAYEKPDLPYVFAPAAPGLSGFVLRRALLQRLAKSGLHPGRLLNYQPAHPARDPLGNDACLPVPVAVARSTARFTLDSDRQIERVNAATSSLNGTLNATESEQLVQRLATRPASDPLPREVVLELTVRRATRPVFAATRLPLARGDLDRDRAARLLDELSGDDDLRLTLAGAGDPLLHDSLPWLVERALRAGLRGVSIETDLCGVERERVAWLGASGVDVVAFHLPALSPATYARVMGGDGFAEVLENLKALLLARQQRGRGVPIVVPVFTRTRENFAEMEAWYDRWLTTLGAAVLREPSTLGGKLPVLGVGPTTPPARRPCERLRSRVAVLSDGTIVPCEEDALGSQALGRIGADRLGDAWRGAVARLRADHEAGRWHDYSVCSGCNEWHRP